MPFHRKDINLTHVMPVQSFKLAGTSIQFHKGHRYRWMPARNQPDWESMGKIFIQKANGESMLLEEGEYIFPRVIYSTRHIDNA